MAKTKVQPVSETRPLLYLNLRPFFLGGLFVILFFSPLMRGLFFQPELLEVQMLTALVFALTWYDQALRRDVSLPRQPLDYAVLALIPAFALSLLTAVHMRPALGELLKVINYFMIYWVAAQAARKEQDLDLILKVCYTSAVVVAVIGLAAATGYFAFPGAYDNGIIMSTLQYKNALAVYLTVLNLVGLALSVKAERPLPKMLFALGNFLMLVVILGTQSRGGWLLYPVGLIGLFAGLPAVYRWRAAYHTVIFLSCGLAAARLFLPRMTAGNGPQAAAYLLAFAAATVALQYAYHRLGLWLGSDHIEDRTRRAVAMGGLAYLGVVVVFYLFYASGAMTSALASVLPEQVAARAETIGTSATTLPERYEMIRDALHIAANHPLTGSGGGAWNALYHQYQASLYWTTEAHNYFAQTLVEAGVLGLLAVLAIWACFIFTVFRLWRRTEQEGGAWMSLWAVAVAALTLGLHSFFDFDLSIPALGILLWLFFGLVRAGINITEENKKSQPEEKKNPTVPRLVLVALAATAGAGLLFLPSARLYAAGLDGARGAQALQDKNLQAAEKYYLDARRSDPYTASYAGDLAQIYAARAIATGSVSYHSLALEQAGDAIAAEPYDSSTRAVLISMYLLMQEYDLAVRESEALLRLNPLLPANYEVLGHTCVMVARYHIERGAPQLAGDYIERAIALPAVMKEKSDEMRTRARNYIKGDPMPPTPTVKLAAGQALYLSGRYEEAGQALQTLSKDKKAGSEARLWQAAALARQGKDKEAKALIDALVRQDPLYDKQYLELLAVP